MGSHPASSAGSGRWHLQPRRKAASSFSSLLRGSSLLPRPRRTGPRIPGQRHSRGDSVSHGGGSRPRRPAPEGKGGEGPGASSRSRRHQGNLRGGTPDPADAVPGSAARPSLSLSLPLCRGAIRNQAALVRCSPLLPGLRAAQLAAGWGFFWWWCRRSPAARRAIAPSGATRGPPRCAHPARRVPGPPGGQRGPAPGALRHTRPASQRAARRVRGAGGGEGKAVGAAAPPQPPS